MCEELGVSFSLVMDFGGMVLRQICELRRGMAVWGRLMLKASRELRARLLRV